ncbi:MAG: type II toxin-antitoxin system PemK/MazF family toxin [Defluviicoccus sp.]|nr:type II toxin-antitoxin system PemK/MazF family toxin [Defluviicoccus sp.]MDG4592044.1 type II toxin-antitoxin system PemK/MazF family toxin [Defluviicoccus sp.]
MPLTFHPDPGTILVCNFNTGFIPPEMVKRRLVVVVSPRLRQRDNLCTIVPLSTTAPVSVQAYHCQVRIQPILPRPWHAEWVWIKADMLSTVSFQRLDLIRGDKDFQGKRRYMKPTLSGKDLHQIRDCVSVALGFRP